MAGSFYEITNNGGEIEIVFSDEESAENEYYQNYYIMEFFSNPANESPALRRKRKRKRKRKGRGRGSGRGRELVEEDEEDIYIGANLEGVVDTMDVDNQETFKDYIDNYIPMKLLLLLSKLVSIYLSGPLLSV